MTLIAIIILWCLENYIFCLVFLVRTSRNIGVMFLCEVALGKEYTVTKDDHSLEKAPAGYNSVVARGSREPGTILPHFLSFINAYEALKMTASILRDSHVPFVYKFRQIGQSLSCFINLQNSNP